MPVTVNVAELSRFRRLAESIEQVPPAPVVHVPVPVAPPLHVPRTTAPAATWCVELCTDTVTRAVHALLLADVDPSRSPTCTPSVPTNGFTVTTTVSLPVAPWLSVTRSVSVCVPTANESDGETTFASTVAPSRHS